MTSTGQTPAKKTNPIVIILIVVVVLVCVCCCAMVAALYFGGDALINWAQTNLNMDLSTFNLSNFGQ
jgi:flagellar basal body-associated protein FliL